MLKTRRLIVLLAICSYFLAQTPVLAEDDEEEGDDRPTIEQSQDDQPETIKPKSKTKSKKKKRKSKYYVEDTERTDAGVFHAAFAFGGNFYVEPKYSRKTTTTPSLPTGDYFKDFGFQAGAYFDYDYSELTENVPLGVRGMFGYKYVLNSTHVFAFDGVTRIMWRLSDKSSFGLGMGVSLGFWYRAATDTSDEETKFLPCGLVSAGFEFNPFMVDLKWVINRIGADSTIMGVELYFGFRL